MDVDAVLCLLQGRIEKLSEVEEKSNFFRVLPDYETTLFENKKNKVTVSLAKDVLMAALPVLQEMETWENNALYEALLGVSEKLGCKSGAVMWSVRIAVSGMAVTPGGATEIMAAIGRGESIRRMRIAVSKL